jgi:hypothetical protein
MSRGERAIAWVKQQNEKTEAAFKADPRYEPFRTEALAILTAKDRTPTPTFRAAGHRQFLAGRCQRPRRLASHHARKLPLRRAHLANRPRHRRALQSRKRQLDLQGAPIASAPPKPAAS